MTASPQAPVTKPKSRFQAPFEVSVFEALVAAQQAEGKKVVTSSPKEKRQWEKKTTRTSQLALKSQSAPAPVSKFPKITAPLPIIDTLTWAHILFGGVDIEVDVHSFAEVVTLEGGTFSEIIFGQKSIEVACLPFHLKVHALPGVQVLHFINGEKTEVGTSSAPTFRVPVEWRGPANRRVPFTRVPGQDNLDLVFLNKDGMFVDLQLSVTTRNGRFYFSIQEIFCGQVVRTSHEKANKIGLAKHSLGVTAGLIVPLYPENAWPGCDYLKTFTKMGPQIIDLAASSDSVSRLSECVVAKWEPPTESALLAEMKERKWQSATVLFYNWVTGTGFALTEDGKRCFLHFSNILNSRGEPIAENGAFPLVESMKEIAVRVGPGNKPGTFAAKDIRRLK